MIFPQLSGSYTVLFFNCVAEQRSMLDDRTLVIQL